MIGCDFDSDWTFLGDSVQVSRKQRQCQEIHGVIIEPGEPYYRCKSVCDEGIDTFVQSMKAFHLCRALHQKFALKLGRAECVIPFGGLRAVDADDIYDCFGLDFEVDAFLFRALKWAKVISDKDAPEEGIEIGPVTDADWVQVTGLSLEYAPNDNAKFDALGNKIEKVTA